MCALHRFLFEYDNTAKDMLSCGDFFRNAVMSWHATVGYTNNFKINQTAFDLIEPLPLSITIEHYHYQSSVVIAAPKWSTCTQHCFIVLHRAGAAQPSIHIGFILW